jgi:hypothetical protein
VQVEYVTRDTVHFTLRSETGEVFTYAMTPKDLAKSVSMSMALINERAATINIEF